MSGSKLLLGRGGVVHMQATQKVVWCSHNMDSILRPCWAVQCSRLANSNRHFVNKHCSGLHKLFPELETQSPPPPKQHHPAYMFRDWVLS